MCFFHGIDVVDMNAEWKNDNEAFCIQSHGHDWVIKIHFANGRGRGGIEDAQASRRKGRTVTTAHNRHEAAAPQHFTYANAAF